MNIFRYSKAGTGAIGAALSVIVGPMLGFDEATTAALGVVLTGLLVWAVPNAKAGA